MKRNISKAVMDGTRIRSQRKGLDLSPDEVLTIWDQCKDNGRDANIDAITAAYSAGLAIGIRNKQAAGDKQEIMELLDQLDSNSLRFLCKTARAMARESERIKCIAER